MGSNKQFFTLSFYMNNKKKREEELGRWNNKARQFLEHVGEFWSILELEIEEPGCQA
jgi:hypothetical protein